MHIGWSRYSTEQRGGLKRTQVDGLFLSLAAVGILRMEKNRHSIVVWNLGWATDEVPAYKIDSNWAGVNLHAPTRARRRQPLIDKPRRTSVLTEDIRDTSN